MTTCGEGKEGLRPGEEVEVEEEAGASGDKKGHPKHLMEGEIERGEAVKLAEGEKEEDEAVEWQWRDTCGRSPSGSDSD